MSAASTSQPPPRMLPAITDIDRDFWTGGAGGQLLIQRCRTCERWVHPPAPSCPTCGGVLVPQPVSGRASVFTFSVNHHAYHPAVPVPYVIALVQLDEQTDLRLATNIVNCDPGRVSIGMPVRVVFEQHGEAFVPVFEPTTDS